jgi:hypothetical protein
MLDSNNNANPLNLKQNMKNGIPPLRKEFWDVNKRLLKIEASGRIYYTEEGKAEYRSLFSRHGYVLENVTTLEDFRRVMQNITGQQLQQSNEELLRLLHDPNTSERERETLADVLGVDPPPVPAVQGPGSGKVVSLSDWTARNKKITP